MSQNTAVTHRTILTRCLAVLTLLFVYSAYLVGATVLTVASTTSADARGHRGGGRGRGHGGVGIYLGAPAYGYGYSPYYVAPAPAPRCYWSRRWRRTICRY